MKALFVAALVTVWASSAHAAGSKRVEVHGHRGAGAVLPENTIAAFKEALRVGVDVLELDLAVSKDNVLVVSHDLFVNSSICLDSRGKRVPQNIAFRDLTLKDIKTFDCGTLVHPKFPKQKARRHEKIPTLDEVFQMVKTSPLKTAKSVHFNIETKIVPGKPELTPSPRRFAQLLALSIERNQMTQRVIVQSFDHRTLKEIKKRLPNIRVSALIGGMLPDLVSVARAINAEYISPHYLWITETEVNELRNAGIKVIPWTVNDKRDWQRVVDMGVDGIISDDPGALIKFLSQKGLR